MLYTRAVRSLVLHSILIVAGFSLPLSLRAASVTLAWDPSPSPNISSYVLLYGTASGAYVSSLNVGTALTGTISDLVAGTPYFFAVTARNSLGAESAPSAEITYTPPLPVISNNPPTLNIVANLTLLAGAGPQVVALSGISSGSATEIQPLTVTATHDNPSLLGIISVTYLSPAPIATLTFTPLPGATGSATIQVTVNDGGSVNSTITRAFTVTVNPTPDPGNTMNTVLVEAESNDRLPPMVLVQDPTASGGNAIVSRQLEQGVAFYGFWVPSGGTYRIWARLKSDAVAPGAFYAKLDGGAETVFSTTIGGLFTTDWRWGLVKPWATGEPWLVNLNGGAHSFVIRCRDAGIWFDAFYVTSDPTFVPPTTPLEVRNDPPTVDPLPDVVIDANSPRQIINLSGITSGSVRESQLLTITASSSNPALIPAPTVSYGSPNSTGLLRFAPATNATGSATISVTVSDNQFTNATIERRFVVTVLAVNNRPQIDAGPDATVNLPLLLNLSASVIDDGRPNPPGTLTTSWSTVSGPGEVAFSASSSLSGTAGFSLPGQYILRLTANDGEYTVSDDLMVTVLDVTPPAVSGEVLEAVDARSFTLRWQTDKPARCHMDFGPTTALGTPGPLDETFTTIHRVSFSNLAPATLYYYRIHSADQAGNISTGGIAPLGIPPVNIFAWGAEDGLVSFPMEYGADDSALGGRLVTSATAHSGSVRFPISVGVLSTYNLWCRIWSPAPGIGSYGVSVDGNAESIFDVAETGWKEGWIWVPVSSRNAAMPPTLSPRSFTLGAGPHEFLFRPLEIPTLLDELILSNDPQWVPSIQGAPPVLTATAVPVDRVHLTWIDATSDEDGFRIEVWDGARYAELATLPANVTSFDDTGLTPGVTRYYRIYAFKDSDRTAYSNDAFAMLGRAPEAPTHVTAVRLGRDLVEITWTNNATDESGFVIERSSDGLPFVDLLTVEKNVSCATDVTPSPRSNQYRIRTFNAWGTSTSEPVDTISAK